MSLRDPNWLREQYETQCMSVVQIAHIVGVDRETVRYWLKRHQIQTRGKGRPPWSERDNEILRAMWAQGETAIAIGKVVGRSNFAVTQHAMTLGLPSRPRTSLVIRKDGNLVKTTPKVSVLRPNGKGYFNSSAAVWRLLEGIGAA